MRSLIRRCLTADPDSRPTAEALFRSRALRRAKFGVAPSSSATTPRFDYLDPVFTLRQTSSPTVCVPPADAEDAEYVAGPGAGYMSAARPPVSSDIGMARPSSSSSAGRRARPSPIAPVITRRATGALGNSALPVNKTAAAQHAPQEHSIGVACTATNSDYATALRALPRVRTGSGYRGIAAAGGAKDTAAAVSATDDNGDTSCRSNGESSHRQGSTLGHGSLPLHVSTDDFNDVGVGWEAVRAGRARRHRRRQQLLLRRANGAAGPDPLE